MTIDTHRLNKLLIDPVIIMFSLILIACAPEMEVYTIDKRAQPTPPEPQPPDWVLEDVEFFNCMQFEEQNWGLETSCKVLVGFNSTPSPPPEPPPPSDDGSDLPPPPQEGECQFIEEEPDPGGGHPYEPDPVNGVDAGPVLYLENDTLSLELIRQDHGTYGIVYVLPDCSADNFPFGQLMDLIVPGSELDYGIPAFTIEEVMAFDVRPDVDVLVNDNGQVTQNIEDAFPMIWTVDHNAPALQSNSDVGSMLELSSGGYPKIDCTPTDSGIDVGAQELQQLYAHTSNPEVMFHRSYQGPEKTLPWGKAMWTSTQYHIRGTVILESEEDIEDTGQ